MENPKIKIVVKDYGTMVAELYPEMAPKTVANFLKLAKSLHLSKVLFQNHLLVLKT